MAKTEVLEMGFLVDKIVALLICLGPELLLVSLVDPSAGSEELSLS